MRKKIKIKKIKKIKRKNKFKKKNVRTKFPKIIFISFLIILYISLYSFKKLDISFENDINLVKYQDSVLPEIKSYENSLNLNREIFQEFRKINSENKLIEENPKFEKSNNPDVSVVMIIFNQAHCLYKGLRSIQNQSIKNIEIILVDGCSQDNSTDVIKEYQKEDPRIILVTHDRNKGILTARTDGVRAATGKYITVIDGDDALMHKDILKDCLYIAQKGKLDVVEFRANGFRYGSPVNVVYDYSNRNASHIIRQPELKTKMLDQIGNSNDYTLFNRVIWGKFIENKLFQNAIKFITPEFTDDFSNKAEDTVMAWGIFYLAKSYYITSELGYYCSYDEKGNKFPKLENKVCQINNQITNLGFYKYYKYVIDKLADNDKIKSMLFNDLIRLSPKLEPEPDFDDRHYKVINYVHDKMLEWNCWNEQQKDYLIKLKEKFKRK